MKPSRFTYHRPHDVSEALALLGDLGDDAKVLAGGQSLLAMMNFRLARPEHLVDIGRIEALRELRREGTGLRIGALTTHHEIETATDPAFDADFAVIRNAMRWIGHLPIRTRGTVGGSMAHADAAAEWCLLAILLDAQVAVIGPAGERVVAAGDFLHGYYTTALQPAEIITALIFPRPAPHAALVEFAERRGDFAVVAVAVDLDVEAGPNSDRIAGGRVAVAGTAPAPIRVPAAEDLLASHRCGADEAFDDVAAAVYDAVEPPAADGATDNYRRALAYTLTARACAAAASANGAGT